MTCDKNANGIADDDEPFQLKELTLRDDGTCDRNGKTEERLQKIFMNFLHLISDYLWIVED